ncbi:MAG TPA: hypothetical protein VI316_04515 [Candidatus Dormibacteraeota bacterium]
MIFAVSAVVLFGICGLAIDSGLSYLSANKVERAAAAGALAGVTYMPSDFATAQSAATAAVERNGYPASSVTVFKVSGDNPPKLCDDVVVLCATNRLGVSVNTSVSNTFTKLLGFGPQHTVLQRAVAEFLSTLTLGQPGSHIGSQEDQINASPQQGFYFLRTEGWGTPRSEGDAYTPSNTWDGTTDMHTISGKLGTEATLPGGWMTLPDCGGYDFQITVPQAELGKPVHVEVYNPSFGPDQPSSNKYRESDGTFDKTKAAQYDTMLYTLFQENDRFNRQTDTPLSQTLFDPINGTTTAPPPPTPSTWTDERTGATLTAATVNAFYHQWVDPTSSASLSGAQLVNQNLPGGVVPHWTGSLAPSNTPYRLRVDTLDGAANGCSASSVANGAGGGHKGYAVRVVDAAGVECAACTIGGLNELAFYTPLVASGGGTTSFDIPMVNIPAVYAGQTIDLFAFDPGDVGNATNYIDVIDPCPTVVAGSCTAPAIASDPSNVKVYDLGTNKATTPSAGLQLDATHWPDQTQARILTSQGGAHPYNGHWILFKIPVPTTYAPTTAANQYWSLRYELTGGTATDTLTIAVGFDGPPVHLVPNP